MSARGGARGGFTLLDMLVALALVLAAMATVVAALPPMFDVVRTVPEATDLQQRARATDALIDAALAPAGAGADLLGEGPLSHAVPAVWPRRLLGTADPPGSAWGDRLSWLTVPAGAAQAPVIGSIAPGADLVPLAWHPACGTHPTCGFRRGDTVLLASRTGAMAMASVADATGLLVRLATTVEQAVPAPATLVVVQVSAFLFDGPRRQLRRADDAAPSQPVTDDVVALRVRYYGTAAPPRWPSVPGVETCAVAADGTPRLGLLGAVPGPPVELTPADLTDGPWCGAGTWRFDADLLRLRAVRLAWRVQAAGAGVRGRSPAWFAVPGQARHPAQEVRDVEVETFTVLPNLAWGQ
ncbi:hypothetical protein TBR22_A37830 [Luteitalea sp. TBR-22]|uniref:hypothetical protein n=1 Tax=Luteitalea sp. TBR-22 TaxID=2802971 RepID=UPI001AF99500|nr:hypothetical protein [Luteitalea sp. TBR-22]BCS34555.1 hypothetical protein TBR22_A37830 [Luteitalea sp. TBR-22]